MMNFCFGDQFLLNFMNNNGVVSHRGLTIFLNAKQESQKLKYFTIQQSIHLQKQSSKRNQNASRYCPVTNLQFQHKPKYHFSRILI
jgi:hypothetical protein